MLIVNWTAGIGSRKCLLKVPINVLLCLLHETHRSRQKYIIYIHKNASKHVLDNFHCFDCLSNRSKIYLWRNWPFKVFSLGSRSESWICCSCKVFLCAGCGRKWRKVSEFSGVVLFLFMLLNWDCNYYFCITHLFYSMLFWTSSCKLRTSTQRVYNVTIKLPSLLLSFFFCNSNQVLSIE